MPVSRFASWLRNNNQLGQYMDLLIESFNPSAVGGLMCRDTLNVSWTGEVFDCDFNQMLKLQWHHGEGGPGLCLWDIDPAEVENREVRTGDHCYACTAGAGSSCGGALV